MPVVDVVNLDGKKVGQVELADAVFGAEINAHLLHEASRWYLAGLRSGTAKTKDKSEVSGAGRKLWRQKGTGRARVGSIRSPLWRHGGTVHGPKPRSYDYDFPRKKVLGALRSALAAKLQDGKLVVVDSFELKEAKTKTIRTALNKLNAKGTTLLVESGNGDSKNLHLSARNLKGVELIAGNAVHPYHLLRYSSAVFSRPALEKLQNSLKASAPKRKAEVA
jgi:large subunit ribosomal protein L4